MCTPTSASRQLKKTKGKSAHDESDADDGVSEELMIGEADLMRTREAAYLLAQSGLRMRRSLREQHKERRSRLEVAGAKHTRAAWHTSSGGNEQGGGGMHVRSA